MGVEESNREKRLMPGPGAHVSKVQGRGAATRLRSAPASVGDVSRQKPGARIAAQAPTAKDVSKSTRLEVYNPATGEPPALVSVVIKQKGRARWIRGNSSPT